MPFTVLDACPDRCSRAFGTHQLLRFEILQLVLPSRTVAHTSIIWILTLVALVIRQLEQSKFTELVKVMVVWIFQSRVLVELLVFCTLGSFLFNHFLNLLRFFKKFLERRTVADVHQLLAQLAVNVRERDTRGYPFLLELALHAHEMEDMTTAETDTRLGTKTLHIANRAVLISIDSIKKLLWFAILCLFLRLLCLSFRGTLFFEAGEALLFILKAGALVPTIMLFYASNLEKLGAFLFVAHIESLALVVIFDLFITIDAIQ